MVSRVTVYLICFFLYRVFFGGILGKMLNAILEGGGTQSQDEILNKAKERV